MPGITTRAALPYPLGTEPVGTSGSGAQQIQDLATSVDSSFAMYAQGANASKPAAGKQGRIYKSTDQAILDYDNGTSWETYRAATPFVSTLPTSPATGQEVYLEPQSSTDAIWHMAWNGSQWVFLGGNPAVYSLGATVASAGGWGNFLNATIPFTGSYYFAIDIVFQSTSPYTLIYYYGYSRTNTSGGPTLKQFTAPGGSTVSTGVDATPTLLDTSTWTAGDVFYVMSKYYATGGTAPNIVDARVRITPQYLS